jgi:hypothetical protein
MSFSFRERFQFLAEKRKARTKRLKRHLRANYLKKRFGTTTDDIGSQCADDFIRILRQESKPSSPTDCVVSVLQKKREYMTQYLARRQLVNNISKVIKLATKRFFSYKKNVVLSKTSPWVNDMPLKANLNDQIFFGHNTLTKNKKLLQCLYANTFKSVIQDYEVLDGESYPFKVACALNKLVYCINAIDWGEFNSLNFVLSIYKKQKYTFEQITEELTKGDALPSPDPAILHDNVLSVFTRINYFDYNDNDGEMKPVIDNALFAMRGDLFPFLVSECILLRFLLTNASETIREDLKRRFRIAFENETVTKNVCQVYPGAFTIIFMLYYNSHNNTDPKGILNMLMDIQAAVGTMDYDRVSKHLKNLCRFICQTVYELEQKQTFISDFYFENFLSNLTFMKYNYFVVLSGVHNNTVDSLPFLVR